MPYPGVGFPIPPFEWPHVGRQWPQYNIESDQAEGLVAWWPTLASAGAGVLRDLYGGHNGNLQNGADWVNTSELGPVLDFPNVNSGVLVADDLGSNYPALTISLWFYCLAKGGWHFISDARAGTGSWLVFEAGADSIQYDNRNVVLTAEYSANKWHFLTVIAHAGGTDGYIDGVYLRTVAGGAANRSVGTNLRIGCRFTDVESVNSYLADYRIYNRALSPALIYQMANDAKWELYRPPRRLWVLAPIGGVLYQQAAAGILTPTGALIRRGGKPLAGTLTPAGVITKRTETPKAGTLTTAGTITKETATTKAGTLTPAGTLIGKAQKALAGTLTTAGTLVRKAGKPLAGTLTPAGVVVKKAALSLAGTLTTAGAIAKETALSFAGTLTPSGAIIAAKTVLKALAGTLTTAGTLTRRTGKSLTGTLTTAGALIRRTAKALSGTLTTIGALIAAGPLFNITHEIGDLSEYDNVVGNEDGDVSVTQAAALADTVWGLNCFIDDQDAKTCRVTGLSAPASGHLRMRLYIDPNTLTIPASNMFIFARIGCEPFDPDSLFHFGLGHTGVTYRLRFQPRDDTQKLASGNSPITDASHYVEAHIERASSNVAADGRARWWLDGVLQDTWNDVDNYDIFAAIDDMRCGLAGGLDVGTSGTFYLDEIKATGTSFEIGHLMFWERAFVGVLTMAGALIRRTGKPLAGILTSAGAITRKVSKSLAGTLTTAGAVIAVVPIALTLWARSAALTLRDRAQALTLWARKRH